MATITPKSICKSQFFKKFRCSVKGAVLLLRSWSTLYRAFSKCKLSGSWLFYFDLPLFTQSVCPKFIYSWSFRCSTNEAVLLLLSWSTLYVAILKCIVSWFYFFSFNWLQLIQKASAKVNFSWNFRCFTKGVVSLLCSWNILYVAISKCIVSWFYFLLLF